MESLNSRGLAFLDGDISGGARTLRVIGSRIDGRAAPDERDGLIDLRGDRLLPGLINAHDHLQLNSLPRFDSVRRYENAREWIVDVNACKPMSAAFAASARLSRDQRLLAGGLKNLLSGVTTVAHHDPGYSLLELPAFPVQVVARFGWSHSLHIDGEAGVRASHTRTPNSLPWIIHAAEGIDEDAAREFERLDALGCIGGNTLLVHGVALSVAHRAKMANVGAGLIWCPSSNLHLFGATADVTALLNQGLVAVGTDSRLTGARDLLEELSIAADVARLDAEALQALVTVNAASLLRLRDRGVLSAGARADMLVLPARMPLSRATRADVRMVMIGGTMLYGDRLYAERLAPADEWTDIRVDGKAKVLARSLATLLCDANITEEGVEIPPPQTRSPVQTLAGAQRQVHA